MIGADALGDKALDKYVVRQPHQGYRRVLSNEGVDERKRFQARGKIPPTGKRDFPTQLLIAKGSGRNSDRGIVTWSARTGRESIARPRVGGVRRGTPQR